MCHLCSTTEGAEVRIGRSERVLAPIQWNEDEKGPIVLIIGMDGPIEFISVHTDSVVDVNDKVYASWESYEIQRIRIERPALGWICLQSLKTAVLKRWKSATIFACALDSDGNPCSSEDIWRISVPENEAA